MAYIDYLKTGDRKRLQSAMLENFDRANEVTPVNKTSTAREEDYAKTSLAETAEMLNERRARLVQESAAAEEGYNTFMNTLITECFMEVFNRSLDYSRDEYDMDMARTFISNYIQQEGVTDILTRMKNNSTMLSEMAALVEETCDKTKCGDDDEERRERCFKIEPVIKNDFLDNLKNTIDIDDVSQSIQLRVSNAMSEFINDTSTRKAKIDETIDQIKDKITPETSDELKESYQMIANRKIEEINNAKYMNLFGKLVENLSESTYRNDNLKRVYCENDKINFDKVIQHVKTLYTVLEMFNTTKLETFTPQRVEEIVSSYNL